MQRQDSPSVLASVLIVALLLLHVLAGSVSLHKKVHCDASAPDHQCVVSLISHGQIDLTETAVAVPLQNPVVSDALPSAVFRLELVKHFLRPGRAPPIPLA